MQTVCQSLGHGEWNAEQNHRERGRSLQILRFLPASGPLDIFQIGESIPRADQKSRTAACTFYKSGAGFVRMVQASLLWPGAIAANREFVGYYRCGTGRGSVIFAAFSVVCSVIPRTHERTGALVAAI